MSKSRGHHWRNGDVAISVDTSQSCIEAITRDSTGDCIAALVMKFTEAKALLLSLQSVRDVGLNFQTTELHANTMYLVMSLEMYF